jgi:hypothetical protein
VGEGCRLEMRAEDLNLNHSCSMAPEEARQSYPGQHNLDLRPAVAEKEVQMEEVRVGEDLVLSVYMEL